MPVMQPKKRTSSKLLGPDLFSGKWVAPANLPGDVGGETQKADIHQAVCPKKDGPSRSRHVSKLVVSNSYVRNSCPETGSPRKCSRGCGVLVVRPKNPDGAESFVTPSIRKRVTSELWCISTLPGVAVVRLKTRTPNETRSRFLGPETRPRK